MSKASLIVRTKYQKSKDLKKDIAKTISYISDKKKADSASINEYDLLKDYMLFGDNDSYLYEDKECFTWSINGDINAKEDLKNINKLDENGTIWSLVLSFDPEFAINKGLITKLDYYNLTKVFMPQLLTSMGLKFDNVTWYCSLHRNTAHPHLHINFFEHKKTISNPKIPYSCIHEMKSKIANYLIDNEKFYKLRDQEFKSITGDVSLKELTKIKNQKLYSDKFRSDLNKMLLNFYDKLPNMGRLQYNSSNMDKYRNDLKLIIDYILMHDSVKYSYAKYLKLLREHQKELNAVYGSTRDPEKKYYDNQLNKLYSKIGNEILKNYKEYKSLDTMEQEKEFIRKHIMNFKFRSRDYKSDATKINIGKDLYKICLMSDLNNDQIKLVIDNWLKRSHYNFDLDYFMTLLKVDSIDIDKNSYYNIMKKLGYDLPRLSNFKNKNFYQEINYKMFINSAINHLLFEIENEEKNIERQIEYELEK